MKFSQAPAGDWPFRAREVIAGKDAVTLATDMMAQDPDAFSAAFRKSPMQRATLRGLQRNAVIVLANEEERWRRTPRALIPERGYLAE